LGTIVPVLRPKLPAGVSISGLQAGRTTGFKMDAV